MARYRYISCHPVTRQQLDPSIRFIDPQWSWVVGGSGTFQGKVTMPESAAEIFQLKIATQPKQAAIYVKNQDGLFPWGGVVIKRKWSRATNQLTITCMEWRAWFYSLILGPTASADVAYQWNNYDQMSIARELVNFGVAGGAAAGCPVVKHTNDFGGKLRNLNFMGTQMKRLGEQIDTVGNRDGGFEWTIESRQGSDGLPELWFVPYYPQQGSWLTGIALRATPGGHGNFIPGDIDEDMSSQYGRFWTTGAGQSPDATWAVDTDPELPLGNVLRFDGSASYSTVSERSTLASHARSNRKFFSPGVNLVPGVIPFERVSPESYHIGDRVPVRIRDRFTDFDLPAVRIVEKKVSMAGAGEVAITLDLTDFMLPEVDTEGSV